MKQLKVPGTLLKTLVLAGLLTACNTETTIAPIEETKSSLSDPNAKISSLTRLTKEGDVTIQYVKSGNFLGRISKLTTGSNAPFNYEYTYNDNNPAGVLWITRKAFSKSTGKLASVHTYKVVNGFCVSSTDPNGNFYEYLYTPQGQLSEVKISNNGLKTGNVSFAYNYHAATNSYRLHTLTELGAVDFELSYSYTSLPDKYPSRNPLIAQPTSIEHGNMDAYLPIFGKFSDVLVEVAVGTYLNGASVPHSYHSSYVTDSDGLVTSRTRWVTSGGSPYNTQTVTLKYSDNWQGI